mmetsp:Transcript_32251/g.102579  ORF Transcript_32251/g.102579 Transcript_32251/m.102579 type:complete len:218 (-) Transcript_32251:641-1294(-)
MARCRSSPLMRFMRTTAVDMRMLSTSVQQSTCMTRFTSSRRVSLKRSSALNFSMACAAMRRIAVAELPCTISVMSEPSTPPLFSCRRPSAVDARLLMVPTVCRWMVSSSMRLSLWIAVTTPSANMRCCPEPMLRTMSCCATRRMVLMLLLSGLLPRRPGSCGHGVSGITSASRASPPLSLSWPPRLSKSPATMRLVPCLFMRSRATWSMPCGFTRLE